MTLRWLHISDIHERDREGHFRKRMYEQIVEKGVKGQPPPDLVFLTGDMAFAGIEKEYLNLEEAFINPLKRALPPGCPIFTIPGNHDVDRDQMIEPRLWIGNADKARVFQAIDAAGAKLRRQMLLPRLAAYAAFDRRVSTWDSDWLGSAVGSVCWSKEINGAKIAVVGVNTAWLCQDDDDWGKLTPGRFMLENAVDEAAELKPDLLIVLGHHPLEALGVEGAPGDGPRVRDRLKQANALYLHGHLHASGSDRIGDALRSTLTIQAPSAFQAHDDKRWRNGLMWGEADLSTGELILEPRLWNEDKREYKFDVEAGYEADRAPGRDGFRLKLPPRKAVDPLPVGKGNDDPTPRQIDLPYGWQVVDREVLAQARAKPPSAEMMVHFFDGILPTWELALARGVQPRAAAERLATRLRAAHTTAPKPTVLLFAGAGGEGKSTALLHAAAVLVEDDQQSWTCLHRFSTTAAMPDDLLERMPMKPGHAWLVLVDDADNIGLAILGAIKRLVPRTDVHVLMAARDAEWQLKRLVPGLWHSVASFHTESLLGLDEADARRIVQGWRAWGDEAMGKLRGRSEDEAVSDLLHHAHELATRKEEGALLGALLVARQGADMRAHVRTLVEGLGRDPVVRDLSLRDVYAMVAAMHAENQLYLSRSVLTYALGSSADELERRVLGTLRREAMLDPGDTFVLTRHRRIAEAACAVLREDDYNINRWYPFLAKAAHLDFRKNYTGDPFILKWIHNLAHHFIDKGERWWPVARATAKAVYDNEPTDGRLLVGYSAVLRVTRRTIEAMALLRGTGMRFRADRGVLTEWGRVAGTTGDYGLNSWLCGRSLADGGTEILGPLAGQALSGLAVAFRRLSIQSTDRAFLVARAACGQLGLRLPEVDAAARHNLERDADEGQSDGIATLSLEQSVEAIRKAVILGYYEVQPTNDPEFYERLIGEPDSYRYTAFLALVSHGEPPTSLSAGAEKN